MNPNLYFWSFLSKAKKRGDDLSIPFLYLKENVKKKRLNLRFDDSGVMTSEADRNDRGGGNGGGGDGKGDSAQQQQQQPSSTSAGRQGGTRVFKKSSPNGKITAYLGLYLVYRIFVKLSSTQANAISSITSPTRTRSTGSS